MAQHSAQTTHLPPNITEADLHTFHKAHFSGPSLAHFSTHFLGPVPDGECREGGCEEDQKEGEEEEKDGLGYYPDGVKRTLTDEQIAMFRHSEIQALLKARRQAEEKHAVHERNDVQAVETEEGELEEHDVAPVLNPEQAAGLQHQRCTATGKNKTKSQKREEKKRGASKQHVKPDLRKRTWDKVERGLESLDYGEEDSSAAPTPAASQRRRVSYEDV